MDWLIDHLGVVMFVVMAALLFTGFPVALILGGVSLAFGAIGWALDVFNPLQFYNLLIRIWGGVAASQVLVAIPMFIFMGVVLERSGIATELLKTLQILTRRIPGGLAMSVTLMGTIMAATTGIVGASVVMLTLIALPAMLERRYDARLAVGTIAASGTLGILIPPSIMLVIMGDLMAVPVGTLFAGALVPGLLLSVLYLLYIGIACALKPGLAPPMPAQLGPGSAGALWGLVFRSFLPPVLLVALVLGSIFMGWATPTEAAGVGSAGALLLAWWKKALGRDSMRQLIESAALTNAMVFFITMGASVFAYMFRALGGDEVIVDLLAQVGIQSAWEVMIFVMVLVFVLGFFFDWLEICLIVLPVFGPLLAQLDFGSHVNGATAFLPWLLVVMAVNLQTSFITPPFGFALFFMKGAVPPSVTMGQLYRGAVPFVFLQMIALAICIAFPELVLWMPRRAGLLD
ncbi:MAG: TRAP transporter large permease subunit [Limnobacter sp.]|nr:TRAP transporter large permease subunit [Limnobacter sp.]